MIVSFRNQGTEDVFFGRDTKAARKTCPVEVWAAAGRRFDYLRSATQLSDCECRRATNSTR